MRKILAWLVLLACAAPLAAEGSQPLRTRYPIILAHGIMGFRAIQAGGVNFGNYFRGVEHHLRERGTILAATNVGMTNAVEERARLLKQQIDFHFPTGKVNIIAHSLGGLDARQMLTHLGMGARVASLTTVGTPHRGTWVADWTVKYVGQGMGVEKLLEQLGVTTAAFHDLTTDWCRAFNLRTPNVPGVRYFSLGGQQPWYQITPPFVPFHWLIKLKAKALAGQELDAPTRGYLRAQPWGADLLAFDAAERAQIALAGIHPADVAAWRRHRGANDGLVPLDSTDWGQDWETIPMDHLDQIGWITTMDAPELYEEIVRGLIAKGL
jgi:pimeloyl-ACP methyl ester carboxylesterase